MEKNRKSKGYYKGWDVGANGTRGGISMFWRDDINAQIVSYSDWHVDVKVEDQEIGSWFYMTGFYGNPNRNFRRESWQLLRQIADKHNEPLPWIVVGDFNEIQWSTEKKGGRTRDEFQMRDFRDALLDCGLEDVGYRGPWFTWERGLFGHNNIRERLDRMVVTENWWDAYPNSQVLHLPFYHSDHRPIIMKGMRPQRETADTEGGIKQFRFEANWIMEETCEQVIKSKWEESAGEINTKLEQLRLHMTVWAKNLNTDRQSRQKMLEEEIERLDSLPITEETMLETIQHKLELNMEIDKQEILWEQRAHAHWLKEGDKNTPFYHKWATQRRRRNRIKGVEDEGGTWQNSESKVAEVAANYFQQLYTTMNPADNSNIMGAVKNKLPEELNSILTKEYMAEEIWEAVREMDPLKAAGSDGFPAIFFQRFWHIVGSDVSSFCLAVLNQQVSIEGNNHTNIVLIPKVNNPKRISQYRPISLCSVLFKIISKVIANRLRQVLHHCIDEAQSGFVPGRLISDNIAVAYELIHSLRSRRVGRKGYLALKLDMSKAYDRVEWNFIEKMLQAKGFDERWIQLVMHCVKSVTYSIAINGRNYSTIVPSRGLRQGDPLSPYLFLICSEGFSTLLQSAAERGQLGGVKASRYGPSVTHLFFADDSLIFGEASIEGTNALRDILTSYSECSGQVVNLEKSVIFYSPNLSDELANEITQNLGVKRVWNLSKYLGLPTMTGRNKKQSFQYLKDRLYERIEGWSTRFLSQAGREVFLKAVLQSLPTYAMSCFLLPKTLCNDFNRIFNRFWWKQKMQGSGLYWSTWKDLCAPKDYGGMGFREMKAFNVALLARQGWRLITQPNSLATRVLQAKYYRADSFLNANLGNNPSYTWRSIWSARGLLESGLCWRIGRGFDVSVWHDRWIPTSPTGQIQFTSPVNHINKVSDLILQEEGTWNRPLITSSFNAEDAGRILQIPLATTYSEDDVMWSLSNSGNYTTKSGYKNLQMAQFKNPDTHTYDPPFYQCYTRLWNLSLPTKIKVCGWRVIQNYLATKQNLWDRHITGNNLCPKCNQSAENLPHLLVCCPKIREFWEKWHITWPSFTSQDQFLDHLEHLSQTETNEKMSLLYICFWSIWHSRNKLVHEQKTETIETMFRFSTYYRREWQATRENVRPIRNHRMQQKWVAPPDNYYKLNFDAGFNSTTKRAKIGGVIRDHTGAFMVGFNEVCEPISDATSAEALACRESVRFAQEAAFFDLIIEGDSLSVIKRLKATTMDRSSSGRFIQDAKNLIAGFRNYQIQHVDRTANSLAHCLAQNADPSRGVQQWDEEPPDFAIAQLRKDREENDDHQQRFQHRISMTLQANESDPNLQVPQ